MTKKDRVLKAIDELIALYEKGESLECPLCNIFKPSSKVGRRITTDCIGCPNLIDKNTSCQSNPFKTFNYNMVTTINNNLHLLRAKFWDKAKHEVLRKIPDIYYTKHKSYHNKFMSLLDIDKEVYYDMELNRPRCK